MHPIVKPFEMVTLWDVIERPIFLFDHRMAESWNFSHFKIFFFANFEHLLSQNQPKKFFENFWKNDEHFFLLFLFLLCPADCFMFSRLDRILQNTPLLPYTINRDIKSDLKVMRKVIRMCVKPTKKWKIQNKLFFWNEIKN